MSSIELPSNALVHHYPSVSAFWVTSHPYKIDHQIRGYISISYNYANGIMFAWYYLTEAGEWTKVMEDHGDSIIEERIYQDNMELLLNIELTSTLNISMMLNNLHMARTTLNIK